MFHSWALFRETTVHHMHLPTDVDGTSLVLPRLVPSTSVGRCSCVCYILYGVEPTSYLLNWMLPFAW